MQPNVLSAQQAITQARTDARNKAVAEQAAYDSVADLQKGDASQIGDIYSTAADHQAAYGKGYSQDLQALQNGAADQSNKLLADNGQVARINPGSGAADVLYAIGGASPANVLSNAGAAFSSAAALRPGSTRGVGAQEYQGALNEGAANAKTLQQQLATINAQRPGLLQQALASLGSQQSSLSSDYQSSKDRQQQLALEAAAYGLNVDKFNASQTAAAAAATAPNVTWSKALGVKADKNGNPIVSKSGQIQLLPGYTIKSGEIVKRGSAAAKAPPRLTAKQTQDYRGLATRVAQQAKNGFDGVDPLTKQPKHYDPIGYHEALVEMQKEGIPTAIALKALNQFYRAEVVIGPHTPAQRAKAKKSGELGIVATVPGERDG